MKDLSEIFLSAIFYWICNFLKVKYKYCRKGVGIDSRMYVKDLKSNGNFERYKLRIAMNISEGKLFLELIKEMYLLF